MKIKIILNFIALAAIMCSCNDKLDETVYSKLTDDNAFTTAENAQAAVNSMYSPLHTIYRTPMFYINDMSTDDCYREGWSFETMNDDQIQTRDELLSAWDGFFRITSRANIVIDQVPAMHAGAFTTGYSQSQMIAEAYFMRGFAYYNLTDVFYQVPLVTSSAVDVSAKLPYAKIDDIEKQIESDLLAAQSGLPMSYSSNDEAGRPTYGAATGMLCRLYMRQAGRARQAGNTDVAKAKWTAALEQVNKVLALEGKYYSLQPSVWNVFDPTSDATIYNNELIFAVRATGKVTSGSWDLGLMFTDWEYDMGWNLFNIPLEAVWKFDKADQRYTKLMVNQYEDVYTPDKTFFIIPPTIDKTGTMAANHTYNGKTYQIISELNCCYSQKYKFLNTGKYIYDTPNNMPVLRLADMLLCKAEILNELNGPSQASIDLVNCVRERAFQNAAHDLKLASYSTTEALRSAICDERLFELNNECVRRPDLIRMGLWKSRMAEYIGSIKAKADWKEKNEGKAAGFYSGMYTAYPTDLKDKDIRQYMPVPKREKDNNPALAGARDFTTGN